MNRLVLLTSIELFGEIARDFNELLGRPDNQDIANEFPATVARYGEGASQAVANFEATRELCKIGEREQFIVFSNEKAIGLCMISRQIEAPPSVDITWPNISGFIMNPYRGQGLGRFSIEQRMKVVDQHFGGHAWTLVREGNAPSEHLVTAVGFRKTRRRLGVRKGHNLYLYDGPINQ